jgi:hypothetical protein
MQISNPFRNPAHRAAFDECVRSYVAMAGGIRRADGSRVVGNSIATTFWRGFDGVKGPGHYISRADRETLGYVYWRAGQAVAKAVK